MWRQGGYVHENIWGIKIGSERNIQKDAEVTLLVVFSLEAVRETMCLVITLRYLGVICLFESRNP